MSKQRRIGLAGFGSVAENSHLPAWQALDSCEVVAIADVSSSRRDRAGELMPGARIFETPLELIEDADIDTLDICAPPNTHTPLLLAGCSRGLEAVVCEKPLVLEEEEYLRVARARDASGTRVISVNNWVHSDLNQHVSHALQAAAIGSVRRIVLRIGRPDVALGHEGWNPRWRTDVSYSGGGIILDHGWHQLYLLLGWMRQPLESVSAAATTIRPHHRPVEDEARIDLQFRQGTGRIELSWTADSRTNEGLLQGDRGDIRALDDRIIVTNENGARELPFSRKLSQSSYNPDWFESVFYYNVLESDFHEADRNFAEAGLLISTVRAAYRSTQQGGTACRPTFATGEMISSARTDGKRSTVGNDLHTHISA
jgi:UDP-N-acetylglucosamine 3-dehydrogenase